MSSSGNIIGHVNSIESFGSVDGPGVRFIFFMQGCPMRCKYCHNPETWALQGGDDYTPEEAFAKAYRYRSYWKGGGGITVSGGEALLQMDFVLALFRIAKEHGVHTALDTSGILFTKTGRWFDTFQELMSVTDLFILDIKQIRSDKHKDLTGHHNTRILEMARYLSEQGKEMWIRHVLVPGITDDEGDLQALGEFIHSLKTVSRTEVLPYHTLGTVKYEKLALTYPLEGVPSPTDEQVLRAEKILGIHAQHPCTM